MTVDEQTREKVVEAVQKALDPEAVPTRGEVDDAIMRRLLGAIEAGSAERALQWAELRRLVSG